jgi:hypothetical protein
MNSALCKYSGLTPFWLILFCCLFAEITRGQQYQVSGQLLTTYYDTQGKQIRQGSSKFEARVDNRNWEITVIPSDGGGDFDRISFDGTNMYVLHDLEKSITKSQKSGASVAPNLATGKVVEKEVPHDSFSDGVGQVWLAYASGGYFEKVKDNDLLEIPFFETKGLPVTVEQTVKRQAIWKMGEQRPKLPHGVSYLAEDGKSTNAEFSVSGFKKIDGFELPNNATFDIFYDPTSIGQPSKQILRIRHIVSAEQFSKLADNLLFPPAVPVVTAVFDLRFNNNVDRIPTVIYLTDQHFLTKVEVGNLPKDKKTILHGSLAGSTFKHAPSNEIPHKTTAKWLVVGFVGCSIIFLYLLRKESRKKTKK